MALPKNKFLEKGKMRDYMKKVFVNLCEAPWGFQKYLSKVFKVGL